MVFFFSSRRRHTRCALVTGFRRVLFRSLAQRKADRAAASLDVALARLTPWSGDASALAALPRLARHEIEDVRSVLAEAETDLQRATDAASRAREEAEALSLEMEQLRSEEDTSELQSLMRITNAAS